jgi:hypothetical protein
MNFDQNECQQFFFITTLFSDTCKYTKNKSWRRCRLYFRGRMQCWWIFDFETDYSKYWVIQNDCGQVWQLCMKIYVATVWVG